MAEYEMHGIKYELYAFDTFWPAVAAIEGTCSFEN